MIDLNVPKPKRVFFDGDNDRLHQVQQAYFQQESDWYDFLVGYKEHLQNCLLTEEGSKSNTLNLNAIDNLDDRLDALDQKFKVTHVVTQEEADGQSNGRFEAGASGLVYPDIPSDAKEAFQLFKDYYAVYQFEVQKDRFFDTYRSFENENALAAEIKEIKDFIKSTDEISYKDACINYNSPDHRYEYKRLTGGYYNDFLMTSIQHSSGSVAASVYGRNILFYEYLKSKIDNFSQTEVKKFENSLDFYENTPDELFNKNAQYWYFEFNGKNKPETNKEYIVFIKALYEIYFFIEENLNRPFACIDKIKRVCRENEFLENERIYIVNRILGILFNSFDHKKYGKVFIQIVDFRESLKSFFTDPEISKHPFQFSFEKIKADLDDIEKPTDKITFLANVLFDFKEKIHTMDEIEKLYYVSTKFLELCTNEIERVRALESLQKSDEPNFKKTVSPGEKRLTLNQIAILYVYKGPSITRENGNYIATQYGHNSGEGLFQKFTYYSKLNNRVGEPDSPTKKKFENKIDLFESVIQYLLDDPKIRQKALDELTTLKAKFQEEYR